VFAVRIALITLCAVQVLVLVGHTWSFDTGTAFALVAASRDPHQFVVTSDDDFPAALADPPGRGIRYVLRNAEGGVDAMRERWPDLGGPDAPWARLVTTVEPATPWSYRWTLWAVGTAS